jgi:hypothetical protein
MDTCMQTKMLHDDDDYNDVASDLTVNLLRNFGPLFYSFTCYYY